MVNACTSAVEILPQKNVNSSHASETFQLNQDVLSRCINSQSNYFQTFCLYPPTQDMLEMCKDPSTYDPSFLFSKMLDYKLTTIFELPSLITYPRFSESDDWTPQPLINPVVGSNVVVDERLTGHTEWFIGTTTVALSSLPNPLPTDITLLRSQHSLIQVVYPTTRLLALEVQFANVPQMIVADVERITRLYDNGNLRIFANIVDAQNNIAMWESFTSDQYGSDVIFAELSYPLPSVTATGTLATLVSPNGMYVLIVTTATVTIAFHAFNNPRFTTSSIETGTLTSAVAAQSRFCFQAMNQNKGTPNNGMSDLAFTDPRCNCIASERLTGRVYDAQTFDTLPPIMQLNLNDTTPCILRNCKPLLGEYTNANLYLANKCISSNGFCQSILPTSVNPNVYVAQDCIVNLAPCVTSMDCPLGSSCKNKQCFLNCTTDLPCLKANPLASCVNGQCQIANPQTKSTTTTNWMWFGVAVCVVLFVVLLAVLVFVSMRNK